MANNSFDDFLEMDMMDAPDGTNFFDYFPGALDLETSVPALTDLGQDEQASSMPIQTDSQNPIADDLLALVKTEELDSSPYLGQTAPMYLAADLAQGQQTPQLVNPHQLSLTPPPEEIQPSAIHVAAIPSTTSASTLTSTSTPAAPGTKSTSKSSASRRPSGSQDSVISTAASKSTKASFATAATPSSVSASSSASENTTASAAATATALATPANTTLSAATLQFLLQQQMDNANGPQPLIPQLFSGTLSREDIEATLARLLESTKHLLVPSAPPAPVKEEGDMSEDEAEDMEGVEQSHGLKTQPGIKTDDIPSSNDLKKMTSKERRQLRNKISARNFRVRRKEYIYTLEGQVHQHKTEARHLREAVTLVQEENIRLKEELESVKRQLADTHISASTAAQPIQSTTSPLSKDNQTLLAALVNNKANSAVAPVAPSALHPNAKANMTLSMARPQSPILTPNFHKDVPNSSSAATQASWKSKNPILVHRTLVPEVFFDHAFNMSDKPERRTHFGLGIDMSAEKRKQAISVSESESTIKFAQAPFDWFFLTTTLLGACTEYMLTLPANEMTWLDGPSTLSPSSQSISTVPMSTTKSSRPSPTTSTSTRVEPTSG